MHRLLIYQQVKVRFPTQNNTAISFDGQYCFTSNGTPQSPLGLMELLGEY